MDLKNKVVAVTGASAGIGKETALQLGRLGASVVLVARRLDRLEAVAQQVDQSGGAGFAVQADITQELQVRTFVDKSLGRFGRIDVLVNNAGAGLYATVEETTAEQMERVWKINCLGTFYCISSVLPVMRRQGGGQIITISSMSGRRGAAFKSAYCAAKFAQIGLMESLRMELSGTGILTTLIFPGATETEFLDVIENPKDRNIRYHGSIQSPGEVAGAVVKAIRKPTVEIITQPFGRLQTVLHAFAPGLTDWIARKTVKRNVDI